MGPWGWSREELKISPPHWDSIPGQSSSWRVTIPTELSGTMAGGGVGDENLFLLSARYRKFDTRAYFNGKKIEMWTFGHNKLNQWLIKVIFYCILTVLTTN